MHAAKFSAGNLAEVSLRGTWERSVQLQISQQA